MKPIKSKGEEGYLKSKGGTCRFCGRRIALRSIYSKLLRDHKCKHGAHCMGSAAENLVPDPHCSNCRAERGLAPLPGCAKPASLSADKGAV